MGERLRLGTRGSPLAVRQAELVAEGLRRAAPGLEVELVRIHTTADHLGHAHLAEIGGKGLFVKEIDEALLERRVDLAVHSLKDLPAELARGLVLVAFPEREDPRDVLVSRRGGGLAALPPAGRVGTGSPRRQAQLCLCRPDLRVEAMRGNVETRLRKLDDLGLDAVVLASAGLRRLGLAPAGAVVLTTDEMLPAVGQGTLAVQAREDDGPTCRLASRLDHPETRITSLAERAFLHAVGGSCATAIAAHARLGGRTLRLDALVATPDGERHLRDTETGEATAPEALGRRLAGRMLDAGAADIIRAGRAA